MGSALLPVLAAMGEVIAPGREEADLSVPETLTALVASAAPQVIVNAAAYTAVDKAESEPDLAFRVNRDAPGILAQVAADRGALLVHYSTDYVFPGDRAADAPAYREDDATGPLGVYGESKLAGEAAVAAAGGAHVILRTAWVYAANGANFVKTMRRLAREREMLRVVADQIGTPTWGADIAAVTGSIIARYFSAGGLSEAERGVFHMTAGGRTSWHGFAEAIVAAMRERESIAAQSVQPITTADYPTPARRPAFSVLDTSRLRDTYGIAIDDWRARFQSFLDLEPV